MKQFLGIGLVIAAMCSPVILALQQQCQCGQSRSSEMQDTVAPFAQGGEKVATTRNADSVQRARRILVETDQGGPIEEKLAQLRRS